MAKIKNSKSHVKTQNGDNGRTFVKNEGEFHIEEEALERPNTSEVPGAFGGTKPKSNLNKNAPTLGMAGKFSEHETNQSQETFEQKGVEQ